MKITDAIALLSSHDARIVEFSSDRALRNVFNEIKKELSWSTVFSDKDQFIPEHLVLCCGVILRSKKPRWPGHSHWGMLEKEL